MLRLVFALVGGVALGVMGCAESLPPEPPWPPPPVVVEDRPMQVEDRFDGAQDDEATRQGALRVFASEQHAVLAGLGDQTRLVRTSTTQSRLRSVLAESERELGSIDRAIAALERDDALGTAGRRSQQDELKTRLRRLAVKLSLIENVLRER